MSVDFLVSPHAFTDPLARMSEIQRRRAAAGQWDERCRRFILASARREGRIGAALPVADFVEPLPLVAARHLANSRRVRDVAALCAVILFSTTLALVLG
mgnify:CR=1 FL=1|jgi:hypothetical protein